MPQFDDSATAAAPPEEVWKLLYDPSRFPDWWAGMETVERQSEGDGDFTFYPEGYPDFPMPQLLDTSRAGERVVVSCLVSDLEFEWRLSPHQEGTRIDVHVEIPEHEAKRLEDQRRTIRASIERLASLAAEEAAV
jgi:uncharacterized protein YndB with AHSA1/START domain